MENDELLIDGSSFKGKVSPDYLLGTWWNHSIVKAPAQISAVSGRIIMQNVKFLGVTTSYTSTAGEKAILIGGTFANNTGSSVNLTVSTYDVL